MTFRMREWTPNLGRKNIRLSERIEERERERERRIHGQRFMIGSNIK